MDEVPGKKLQADASALEVIYCQPCSQDGETLPAEAYCTICKEFMCSICTSVHKKQRMTKSHTLLDKGSMPTTMTDLTSNEKSKRPCDIHPEEYIKYFCPTHQTLNCGHCSVLDHQSCKQQIISEIAKAFKEGHGYEAIKQIIVQLLRDTDACLSNVKANIKLVEDLEEHEIAKIRNYRDQINKFFDERENALLKIIDKMQSMDEALMDSLKSECDNLKIEVSEIKAKLEAHENNTSQLFVEAQIAKEVLKRLQSNLVEINMRNSIHQYQFMKDFATEKLLGSETGLGTIEMASTNALDKRCERACSRTKDKGDKNNTTDDPSTSVQTGGGEKLSTADADISIQAVVGIQDAEETKKFSANTETEQLLKPGSKTSKKTKQKKQTIISTDLTRGKYTLATEIQVKSPSNIEKCRITGMLLLPGDRLLLGDINNDAVKLIDLNTSSLVAEVIVPTGIWDICLLPGDRVAASVTGRIQFLKTQGQLSLGNNIKVNGDCYGIGYDNNNLIVTYKGGKVEKMDMEGKVLKTISNGWFLGSPFKKPFYLRVVSEGSTKAIYVSDEETNIITKLDMNLNILQTFQDPALRAPRGITLVGNQLLICGMNSRHIMCLDMPSGHMTQLLGEKERIASPGNVCYSQQQNKMYVSEFTYADGNNYVKVYSLNCYLI